MCLLTIRCCTWFRFWLCSLLITEIVILSCNFTSQLPIVRNEIFLKNWTFGLPYTSQEADTGLIWEISLVHEYLMKRLPENVIIKKKYSKNLISLLNKIFQQNFNLPSVLIPITWICWTITKILIFGHTLVKYDLKFKHQ